MTARNLHFVRSSRRRPLPARGPRLGAASATLFLAAVASSCVGPLRQEGSPPTGGEGGARTASAPGPWRVLGRSVEDRPILVRTWGRGPLQVLWIGGIHGNEVEGMVATEELPPAAAAAGLLDGLTLTVVRDLNPDGRVHGTRHNVRGVDLNRNWPTSNFRPTERNGPEPLSEPESRALMDLLDGGYRPDLVMVAHSWGGRSKEPPFINFDGPAEGFAERFAAAAGWRVEPSDALHPTPGSLGTFFGVDRGVPILTIEWARPTPPEDAWAGTRGALLEVLELLRQRS